MIVCRISFSGSLMTINELLDHHTLKVAGYDTQFARVKPTNKGNIRLQLHSPPRALYPPLTTTTTPPPPLSNRHEEGEINHKCRRCGKSAFYLHGPMNKQKSKQFACFAVSGYASSNNHQVVFRARCFIEYSRHTLAVATYW